MVVESPVRAACRRRANSRRPPGVDLSSPLLLQVHPIKRCIPESPFSRSLSFSPCVCFLAYAVAGRGSPPQSTRGPIEIAMCEREGKPLGRKKEIRRFAYTAAVGIVASAAAAPRYCGPGGGRPHTPCRGGTLLSCLLLRRVWGFRPGCPPRRGEVFDLTMDPSNIRPIPLKLLRDANLCREMDDFFLPPLRRAHTRSRSRRRRAAARSCGPQRPHSQQRRNTP